MKWISAIALTFFLAACGNAGVNDNHGIGWDFEAEDAIGLRVHYVHYTPFTLAEIEQAYYETASCVGSMPAPGPLVAFVDDVPDQYGGAVTWYDTGTIAIEYALIEDSTRVWAIHVFRHEAVHYLLHRDRILSIPDNNAHRSLYFNSCT